MSFKPYRKPNNEPTYINKDSNHPTSVLKELCKSIAKRISEISSNKIIFKESIGLYQNALKTSGFIEKLEYSVKDDENHVEREEKKKRKRKIIWFNPPFSKNVKTNIGKLFFKLISKHFPKKSKFYKIFNKNNVKLSYSYTRNMGAIISAHNKSRLNKNDQIKSCNCRVKLNCPLENKCLTSKVILQSSCGKQC